MTAVLFENHIRYQKIVEVNYLEIFENAKSKVCIYKSHSCRLYNITISLLFYIEWNSKTIKLIIYFTITTNNTTYSM